MASYVGPAQLVVDGAAHDVAVNLQSFVDLRDGPAPGAGAATDPGAASAGGPGPAWRGVVVDAGFVPRGSEAVPAEVRLPDGRGGVAMLTERRLEGRGSGLL
jgi:hypothetical protein